MKKMSMWLYAMVFALVLPFSLISCGGDEPDKGKEEDKGETIAMDYLYGDYQGDAVGTGSAAYMLEFSTGDLFIGQNTMEGSGEYIIVAFTSDKHDLFPAEGTYTTDKTMGEPFWIMQGSDTQQGPNPSSIYNVVDGQVEGYSLITDCEMTISGNAANAKVSLTLVNEEGKKVTYTYSGELPIVDNGPYSIESDATVNETKTMTSALVSATPAQGYRQVDIELRENDFIAFLSLFVAESGSITGTYPITKEYDLGVCAASQGVYGASVTPSICGTLGSDGGLADVWFLAGGEVVVADDKITVNATSVKGSKFNLTYNGTWTLEGGAFVPQKLVAPSGSRVNSR